MDPILHFIFAIACCTAVVVVVAYHREHVRRRILECQQEDMSGKLEKLEKYHSQMNEAMGRRTAELQQARLVIQHLQANLAQYQDPGIAGMLGGGGATANHPEPPPTGLN